jgi:hypothetical protein
MHRAVAFLFLAGFPPGKKMTTRHDAQCCSGGLGSSQKNFLLKSRRSDFPASESKYSVPEYNAKLTNATLWHLKLKLPRTPCCLNANWATGPWQLILPDVHVVFYLDHGQLSAGQIPEHQLHMFAGSEFTLQYEIMVNKWKRPWRQFTKVFQHNHVYISLHKQLLICWDPPDWGTPADHLTTSNLALALMLSIRAATCRMTDQLVLDASPTNNCC